MGLANKSVVLYESIKVGKKWVLCPVYEDPSHFSNGPYYVSWCDGKKKQMDPPGAIRRMHRAWLKLRSLSNRLKATGPRRRMRFSGSG